MTIEHNLADAFRIVALRLEDAIERGKRSNHLNANDLLETLHAIADRLDPPIPDPPDTRDVLVVAANALLSAHAEQRLTPVEWDRLRQAVDASAPR